MGRLSQAKRKRILQRDGHRCQNCGATEGPGVMGTLEVDHIVPRSKGGSSKDDNLQILCGPCNRRKLDHLPDEAPEQIVMRWCEEVFGHQACNHHINTARIRRLLSHLAISQEFSTNGEH